MKRMLGVLVIVTLAWLPLTAQDPSLPIRRLPDGKPDLSGVYAGPAFANKSTRGVPPPVNEVSRVEGTPWINREVYVPLIRPEAEKFFNRKPTGDVRIDDPPALCLPLGFPHIAVVAASAQQIFQPPGYVVILYESSHFFHVIPIGAPNRPHSDWDGELTFMGDAIGWWEGETLVVDTIGLKEWPVILYHSDALHVVERFTPIDAYRIDYQMTWDDPKVFTKPWGGKWKMLRQTTWKLFEHVCEENNRCPAGQCAKADVQK